MTAMLTTIDNPFDPFTDFEKWYKYDMSKGYNTCSYLARIAHTSDQLPEAINQLEIEAAIDGIAYTGIANIGFHVFSTEDFEVFLNN